MKEFWKRAKEAWKDVEADPSVKGLDRLIDLNSRTRSEGQLVLARNSATGAAAVCLAILLQLVQVSPLDNALVVSVWGAAVGLPLWIGLALNAETYLNVGKRSYAHFDLHERHTIWVYATAGAGLLVAVGGVIFHLLPRAAIAFAGTSFLGIMLYGRNQTNLAKWLFRKKESGSAES